VNGPGPATSPGPVSDPGPLDRPAAAEDLWPGRLGRLALARGTIDYSAHLRHDADWLEEAWRDPRTRVLVVADGEAPVRHADSAGPASAEDAAELVLVPPAQAPEGTRVLLGVETDGVAYFAVLAPPGLVPAPPGQAGTGPGKEPGEAPPGVRYASLRQVGAVLSDRDAGLLTQAVALANWHATHMHCPRCGAVTEPAAAGHTRVCPVDGSEHFPRVDPAVIMMVLDPAGRCLLARNRRWPERRVSILAGFVEPGESAEQAVAREVAEEVGIGVGDARYLGSQPWPMPQSLMLGFAARATGSLELRADLDEIAEAAWYSRDDLRAALDAGELRLPPPVSIARQIIESWYGSSLSG
jgi:NAD+ diphosphatase